MAADYRLSPMGCQNCGDDTDRSMNGRVDVSFSGRSVDRTTYLLCGPCGRTFQTIIETQFARARKKAEAQVNSVEVTARDVTDAVDAEFKLLPEGE